MLRVLTVLLPLFSSCPDSLVYQSLREFLTGSAHPYDLYSSEIHSLKPVHETLWSAFREVFNSGKPTTSPAVFVDFLNLSFPDCATLSTHQLQLLAAVPGLLEHLNPVSVYLDVLEYIGLAQLALLTAELLEYTQRVFNVCGFPYEANFRTRDRIHAFFLESDAPNHECTFRIPQQFPDFIDQSLIPSPNFSITDCLVAVDLSTPQVPLQFRPSASPGAVWVVQTEEDWLQFNFPSGAPAPSLDFEMSVTARLADVFRMSSFSLDFHVSVADVHQLHLGDAYRLLGVSGLWTLSLDKEEVDGDQFTLVFATDNEGNWKSLPFSLGVTGQSVRLTFNYNHAFFFVDDRIVLAFDFPGSLSFGTKGDWFSVGPDFYANSLLSQQLPAMEITVFGIFASPLFSEPPEYQSRPQWRSQSSESLSPYNIADLSLPAPACADMHVQRPFTDWPAEYVPAGIQAQELPGQAALSTVRSDKAHSAGLFMACLVSSLVVLCCLARFLTRKNKNIPTNAAIPRVSLDSV